MANLVYRSQETAIQFSDNDGDYAITLANLINNAGRLSARADRGIGSKPMKYKWRASVQFQATGLATGQHVQIFLCESDGTYADGDSSTANSVMTWGQASNMQTIGNVWVQSATANTSFIASGTCWIMERYFQIGVFNFAAALRSLYNINRVIVVPMPDEIQGFA